MVYPTKEKQSLQHSIYIDKSPCVFVVSLITLLTRVKERERDVLEGGVERDRKWLGKEEKIMGVCTWKLIDYVKWLPIHYKTCSVKPKKIFLISNENDDR